MHVQLVLSPVLLDNLRLGVEQITSQPSKQLRGDSRQALIELYSDAIAYLGWKRDVGNPIWKEVNQKIIDKYDSGTLMKIKEKAHKLVTVRCAENKYSPGVA